MTRRRKRPARKASLNAYVSKANGPDLVVFDESHLLRGYGASQKRVAEYLRAHPDVRAAWGTGERPFPHQPEHFFASLPTGSVVEVREHRYHIDTAEDLPDRAHRITISRSEDKWPK